MPPEEPMQLEDFYRRGFGFSFEPEEGALCGAGFGGWGGSFGYGVGGGAGFGVAAADPGGDGSGSAAAAAASGVDSTTDTGEVVIPEPPLYWILAMALLFGTLIKRLRERSTRRLSTKS